MASVFFRRRNAIIVGAGACAAAACTFLAFRIFAIRYEREAFSALLVLRLWSSVTLAFCALGLPVAVQRTVPFCRDSPARSATAAVVGLALAALSLGLLLSGAALIAPAAASLMSFPDAAPLWQSLMALTFAQTITLMTGYVQMGRGRIVEGTLLSLGGSGLVPLLVLIIAPATTPMPAVLLWTGLMSILFAIPSLLEILVWALRLGLTDVRAEASELLRYGLPRTVASGLEVLLEAAVPWFALRQGFSLTEAGAIGIGLTVVRMLGPLSFTLNQLLLPAAASLAAQGDSGEQAAQTRRVARGLIQVGLLTTLVLLPWCDVLIRLWVGSVYDAESLLIRLLVVATLPVFVFNSLRGLLDGATRTPLNTRNLLVANALFLALAGGGMALSLGPAWLALAYLIARSALAWRSLRDALTLHQVSWQSLGLPGTVIATSLVGMVAAGARWALGIFAIIGSFL